VTAARIALTECCEIVQGGRHKLSGNDFVEHGFPAYGAGGMNGLLATWEFEEAAVVLSSIGARCGKCFYVNGKWSSLANTQIIRPNPEKVDCKFLWYQINDESRWPKSGTGQPFIKPSDVKNHLVCLPPLPEQRRIAAILDQADALRAKRRETLAQLDRLTQAIFVEMFGDPATNPKRWPMGHIGDLLDSASYGTSEKSSSVGEFPVLRMNNLTRTGELDLSDLKYMDLPLDSRDRYLAKAGDVLFNRTNSADLVGKTAMVPANAPQLAYAGYLVRLRVNQNNEPVYLTRFLNSAYAKRMLRSMCKSIVGMANINAKEIQAMKIALPPLALQQTFATRIQAIEALKANHRTALAELDALFTSLQHRAFRGEL